MPGYKSKKLMAEMKVTDYEAAFRKLVDKWHESVRHYEERIEKLEAALGKIMDTDPDEGTSWFHDIARKALEGKDDVG